MNHTKTRKLIYDSLLAGIALAMYLIELQIPSPVPIPGVKLGLANIVTLFAVYLLNPADAAAILMVRILLGESFPVDLSHFYIVWREESFAFWSCFF